MKGSSASSQKGRLRSKLEILKHLDRLNGQELEKIKTVMQQELGSERGSEEEPLIEENEYGLVNEEVDPCDLDYEGGLEGDKKDYFNNGPRRSGLIDDDQTT